MNDKVIRKLEIPEAPEYTYEVGIKFVESITEEIIQIGTADGWTPSKLVYVIRFSDGYEIYLSADVRGIVLYKW